MPIRDWRDLQEAIDASAADVLAATGSGGAEYTPISSLAVSEVAGTANQILVNGGLGPETGAVTLSLAQDINVSSAPAFSAVSLTNALTATNGGTGLSSCAQGDLLFASAANTFSKLPKSTAPTRYLANAGASNNPSWSQIDLTNGVTGDLPLANLAQGSARSVVGVTGNSTADVASIQGTQDQVLRINGTGSALAFGALDVSKAAAVTDKLRVDNGGTGLASATAYAPLFGGTSTTGAFQSGTVGSTGQVLTSNGAGTLPTFQASPGAHAKCQGRLTLESGVPISTSNQSAKTTVYFTPYKGNRVGLYDGTSWSLLGFSETSLALGTLTSGKNYDVFAYNNAGTLALELSAAWTSDTARNNALTLQDGIYVKSSATTRRYIGTIRTTSTTTTEDSATKRLVWNYHNAVQRPVFKTDSTSSWNYSTATWRQARSDATNQIEAVFGLSGESRVELRTWVLTTCTGAGQITYTGIGEDSTTAVPGTMLGGQGNASASTGSKEIMSSYTTRPSIGYHYYAWLEQGHGSGTQTFWGDGALHPGIAGFVEA